MIVRKLDLSSDLDIVLFISRNDHVAWKRFEVQEQADVATSWIFIW